MRLNGLFRFEDYPLLEDDIFESRRSLAFSSWEREYEELVQTHTHQFSRS